MYDFKKSEIFLLNEARGIPSLYPLLPQIHTMQMKPLFFHHEHLPRCPLFSMLAFKTSAPTELLLGIASPSPSFAPEISLLNLKIVNSAANLPYIPTSI